MSKLVCPRMPSPFVRHLLVVALVLAAHAGVIGLLESGLQNRPASATPSPPIMTVGLIAPAPVAVAHAKPSLAPTPAAPQSAPTPPASRPPPPRPSPTPPAPAPAAQPLPALEQTAAISHRIEPLSEAREANEARDAVAETQPDQGRASESHTASHAESSSAGIRTAAVTPTAGAGGSGAGTAAPRIELPSAAARHLNNPPPPYPPMSRRLGEQGRVIVRARIEVDGSASQAEISASSGYTRLDQTALHSVLNWRYVPGTRNGVPEAMWFHVPILFVLE